MQDWSDSVLVQVIPGAMDVIEKPILGNSMFIEKNCTYTFTYRLDFPGAVALIDYEDFIAAAKARFEKQLRHTFRE